jgi:hypothetical protein
LKKVFFYYEIWIFEIYNGKGALSHLAVKNYLSGMKPCLALCRISNHKNEGIMKKVIYITGLLMSVSIMSFKIYAGSPPADKHEFVSTEREINFEMERRQGEVALYFESKVFQNYDEILVERSGSDNGNYSVCKTIELSQAKISGDYFKASDHYPMNAQKDCYYRIKTVAKDGTMKTFPPLILTAISN